jgi:hypothetical protein
MMKPVYPLQLRCGRYSKDYEKYKLPKTLNEPTGKGVLAKFEDADNRALYLPDARMSSLPVKRGGSFSFLTIFTFAIPELLNLI